ncbi:MAG: triose-phosphate isomerase [Candidatus Aenigmarchaeota archaeon]|nr:triose-phosphate isomerase [Candidatus Aenigmarchaeota archaeon]
MKPVFLINCKAYEQGIGDNAVKIAKAAERVAREEKIDIIISVQPADIRMVSETVKIPVFAQHVDPVAPGSHTGHVLPESVKGAGAKGSLISHAERRLDFKTIENTIKRCKEIGLVTVVCAPNVKYAKKITSFGPDYVAYEDPVLIGSGKSISQTKPDSVKRFVKEVKKINPKTIPLCGAGVSTGKDAESSLKLGTSGVLVASAVVKADDPYRVIKEIAGGLR